MDYAVVTGISRGLGEAVARLLLECGIHVFGISRNGSKTLERFAKENNARFTHAACDLNNIPELESTIGEIADRIFADEDLSSLYIVNNAAIVTPIERADRILDTERIAEHMQINLVSPMFILNTFLHKANSHDISLVGVNVTSGASVRPIYGFSTYCSAKAGLDMYTKTVAAEQEILGLSHKIFGFSPGVMDTGMQEEIRSAPSEAFIEVEKFRDYKRQNMLSHTDEIGGILVNLLMDASNALNGKIYNVKDYL